MEQSLKREMQSYSNERIMNNVRQQGFFSQHSVEIAKEIALERKLITPQNINSFDPAEKRNKELNRLTDLGYNPQIAKQVANQQYSRSYNQSNVSAISHRSNYSNSSSDSGIGITGIFFLFLFIIKIFLLIARAS